MRKSMRFVGLLLGLLPLLGSLQNGNAKEPSRTELRIDHERRRGTGAVRDGKAGMRGGIATIALQLKGITPEQKSRLEVIQKEAQGKMQQMQASARETTGSGKADRSQQRDQRMKMMAEQRAKVEAVLTEPQKQELRQKLPQMRGDRQMGKRGGPERRKQ